MSKENPSIKKTQIPKEFDQDHLMSFIQKFSFPRCIGTDGEKKARKMAFNEFKDLNLQVYKEDFICSLAYARWLLPLFMVFFLVLLSITQIIKFFFPDFSILSDITFITGFLISFLYVGRKNRTPQKFLAGKN